MIEMLFSYKMYCSLIRIDTPRIDEEGINQDFASCHFAAVVPANHNGECIHGVLDNQLG